MLYITASVFSTMIKPYDSPLFIWVAFIYSDPPLRRTMERVGALCSSVGGVCGWSCGATIAAWPSDVCGVCLAKTRGDPKKKP